MNSLVSTVLALLFLVVGAVAAGVMIVRFGGRTAESCPASGAKNTHRILGWTYVALFLLLFATMLFRVPSQWEEWSANVSTHVTLALALFVLLTLKVSIARRLPGHGKHLFPLGTAIFLTGFVLVWITAGHYLTHAIRGTPYVSRSSLPDQLLDSRLGLELLVSKCSTCHVLQKIMIPREYDHWESVVNRMVGYANSHIKPDEAALILGYVSATFVPQPRSGAATSPLDRHCSPCHSSAFIMDRHFDRKGWEDVVRRMSEHAPDLVPPAQVTTIVDYLERGSR